MIRGRVGDWVIDVLEARLGAEWPSRASAARALGGLASVEAYLVEHGDAKVPADRRGRCEAVLGVFDPTRITYRQLLAEFFEGHDPTQGMRQGNDTGPSYRSAIFYTSDEQKRIAQKTIAEVDASGLWPGKVVTEVAPAGDFWEAEPEHQDYLERYPNGYTCHFVRPNWKMK